MKYVINSVEKSAPYVQVRWLDTRLASQKTTSAWLKTKQNKKLDKPCDLSDIHVINTPSKGLLKLG